MEFFKNFYSKLFPDNVSKQDQDSAHAKKIAEINKARETWILPDVLHAFDLRWAIEHDEDFEDILIYRYSTNDGALLLRELAIFQNASTVRTTVTALKTKYASQLRGIYLAPGVGTYIGGDSLEEWEVFLKFLCDLGYERVAIDDQYVKRYGPVREILAPETIFKMRDELSD